MASTTSSDKTRNDASGGVPVPNLTEDTYFGRVVVEQRLATQEELQTVLSRQRALEQQGKRVGLSELMVAEGVLTSGQAKRLSSQMDDSGGRPAQQIPGFQIIEKIGSGAMATVY